MRILRLNEVKFNTGLAKSTIYKFIELGKFPKPISLGQKAVGWIETEIEAWIAEKISERDAA